MTECPSCGKKFTANNIQGRLMDQKEALGTNDPHLYGGNAKRFANASCCGKDYILWLKPISGSYKVLTVSEKKPKRRRSA